MKKDSEQRRVSVPDEKGIETYHVPLETSADAHNDRLPIDPRTGQPLTPTSQPGYYPGYSTLSQQDFWDEATRNLILHRVNNVPPIRFFSSEQAELAQAVCDRLLPQDDRDEAHKIPILNYIDARLYENKLNGYQYEDMPSDRDAWILGLQGIDVIAQHMHHQPFVRLGPRAQDEVLFTIHQDQPPAGHEIWDKKMSAHHFWALMMNDVVTAYYAHPYAWDEIGFGGPAYPRGYMRLEYGKPEPWEVEEQRYDWAAPPTALSDRYVPIGGPTGHARHAIGQGGTH